MRIINSKNIPRERRYKFYDLFEDIPYEFITKDPLEHLGSFSHNGVLYSPCSIKHGHYAICETFEFKDNVDHEYTGKIVCPYCGHEKMDSWEADDSSDDEICSICESEFSYERIVTVEYVSKKKKKNTEFEEL